jgi:hypothetical protein
LLVIAERRRTGEVYVVKGTCEKVVSAVTDAVDREPHLPSLYTTRKKVVCPTRLSVIEAVECMRFAMEGVGITALDACYNHKGAGS